MRSLTSLAIGYVQPMKGFPIGLSDPPPVDGIARWESAWAEIARGRGDLRPELQGVDGGRRSRADGRRRAEPDGGAAGLQVWLALAGVDNDLGQKALLNRIVNIFKGHPAWAPGRERRAGARSRPAPGCVAVYQHLRTLDPDHPLVLIEAPRAPAPNPDGADSR